MIEQGDFVGIRVTPLRNTPSGWAYFRAFRQKPAPMFRRQHGNLRHGRYSKQGIADLRMLRMLSRMLCGRLAHVSVPGLVRPTLSGWSAYRAGRWCPNPNFSNPASTRLQNAAWAG